MAAAAPEWESEKVTTNKGLGGDGRGHRSVLEVTNLNRDEMCERRVMLW